MKFEQIKILSSEELAQIQKNRILETAELIKDGAQVTPDGVIIATDNQITEAGLEMGEDFYNKNKKLSIENLNLKKSLTDKQIYTEKLIVSTIDELAKKHKIRIFTDADLINDGASVSSDGVITVTYDQQLNAKLEMGQDFCDRNKKLVIKNTNLQELLNNTNKADVEKGSDSTINYSTINMDTYSYIWHDQKTNQHWCGVSTLARIFGISQNKLRIFIRDYNPENIPIRYGGKRSIGYSYEQLLNNARIQNMIKVNNGISRKDKHYHADSDSDESGWENFDTATDGTHWAGFSTTVRKIFENHTFVKEKMSLIFRKKYNIRPYDVKHDGGMVGYQVLKRLVEDIIYKRQLAEDATISSDPLIQLCYEKISKILKAEFPEIFDNESSTKQPE